MSGGVIPFPVPDPRDDPVEAKRQRFRIYRMRGELELVATTPDPQGVGLTLCTLAEEGEFEDAAVGVLDTKGAPKGSGVWIVNPYEPGVPR